MWNWWLCGLLKVGHILKLVEKFSSSIKEANLLEARPTPEKAKGWLNPRPEKKMLGSGGLIDAASPRPQHVYKNICKSSEQSSKDSVDN